jgi:hypothetical protein
MKKNVKKQDKYYLALTSQNLFIKQAISGLIAEKFFPSLKVQNLNLLISYIANSGVKHEK